ncbi:carbohydrate ABC transporter membrane protein 1, CUT1 family [Amycolatopsis marina]|uniref:Carbohydrate ABC transporter membrane protein 1, CUT1 family n=1 Tax=Amycolatopsis marina TaxID=490629 RepID=A0A1I1C0V2_9PSEU|nr:sugar ABC transporter permease [Amycolatopsis marina]SFB55967.1 carbohydrate ABC transporter membrane protein 1, CUT1 family [Amycolatopsis marina]
MTAPPSTGGRRGRGALQRVGVPYLHLAPALLAIGLTTIYPLIAALINSFRHWRLNETRGPQEFVGLDQYSRAFGEETFFNSVLVTAQFTVLSVVLSVGLGLGIALVLNRATRLSAFTKALLILPFAVAPALKGFSWRFMLNPDYGVYDRMINSIFPFTEDIDWLGSPFWALFVLVLTEVWGWAPLIALMFLGGLGSISPEIRAAARVDGANPWQEFWRVTFPLLRPLILIVVFLKAVFSVKVFDQVVTTTGGGPGRATETMNFYAYAQGFNFLDIGYASAVSWLIVLILGVLAVAYLIAMSKQEEK